jgi:SecD/SecF fusion protein
VANKVKVMQNLLQLETKKRVKYLDSIGKRVFNLGFTNFTSLTISDKQINKGLDLEGGINVILKSLLKTY